MALQTYTDAVLEIIAACEQLGGSSSIGSISRHIEAVSVSAHNIRSAERYSSSQLYLDWKSSSSANQFLWLRGPPNSGKTTKAIQIVKQLNDETSFSEGEVVLCFLCSKEPSTSASIILRSAIAQLILRCPTTTAIPDDDKDALLKALNPKIHTKLPVLWMLLRQILQASSECTIHWVIDGLDALPADELDQLVRGLRSLWDAWNRPPCSKAIWLKILVTSLPYAAIFREGFADLPYVAPDEEVLGL